LKYRTIVADPPWEYDSKGAFKGGSWATTVNGDKTRSGVAVDQRYQTLTLNDICAMPLDPHICDDAYLWLWIPNEHLLKGVHALVCDAWGFTVKGSMVWVKTNSIGVGYWLRYNHEHIILATRGTPGPLRTGDIRSSLLEKRAHHSAKPEAFFRLVERACPGPYLSLFERGERGEQGDLLQERKRWTVWGNEVGDPFGIGFGPWK